MKLHYLNHASIIVESQGVRLLTDPWYSGTAFEDGWGLRFDNPKALEMAATCTHLWVSHFHQDHFHVPTLKKLFALNPEIVAIGNHSYNFQLDRALAGIGAKHVLTLGERQATALADGFTITRYPTTGIDNMLLIQTPDGNILNYNDCSLPPRSQRWLKKKIGPIDILLTNFNHAGKLLLYPYPDAETIRKKLVESFTTNYKIFDPRHVLPFASHHYYRAPESVQQNGSMIAADDLVALDDKITPWKVGESYQYDRLSNALVKIDGEEAGRSTFGVTTHQTQYGANELVEAASTYCKTLRAQYGVLRYVVPPLAIRVSDLGASFLLSPRKGLLPYDGPDVHIEAHSEALHKWFTKPYGTDSFVVGAHFSIVNRNKIPLRWQIVIGLLVDNKIAARSLVSMLFQREGRRFLVNRREEILGILLTRRIAAEYHNEN